MEFEEDLDFDNLFDFDIEITDDFLSMETNPNQDSSINPLEIEDDNEEERSIFPENMTRENMKPLVFDPLSKRDFDEDNNEIMNLLDDTEPFQHFDDNSEESEFDSETKEEKKYVSSDNILQMDELYPFVKEHIQESQDGFFTEKKSDKRFLKEDIFSTVLNNGPDDVPQSNEGFFQITKKLEKVSKKRKRIFQQPFRNIFTSSSVLFTSQQQQEQQLTGEEHSENFGNLIFPPPSVAEWNNQPFSPFGYQNDFSEQEPPQKKRKVKETLFSSSGMMNNNQNRIRNNNMNSFNNVQSFSNQQQQQQQQMMMNQNNNNGNLKMFNPPSPFFPYPISHMNVQQQQQQQPMNIQIPQRERASYQPSSSFYGNSIPQSKPMINRNNNSINNNNVSVSVSSGVEFNELTIRGQGPKRFIYVHPKKYNLYVRKNKLVRLFLSFNSKSMVFLSSSPPSSAVDFSYKRNLTPSLNGCNNPFKSRNIEVEFVNMEKLIEEDPIKRGGGFNHQQNQQQQKNKRWVPLCRREELHNYIVKDKRGYISFEKNGDDGFSVVLKFKINEKFCLEGSVVLKLTFRIHYQNKYWEAYYQFLVDSGSHHADKVSLKKIVTKTSNEVYAKWKRENGGNVKVGGSFCVSSPFFYEVYDDESVLKADFDSYLHSYFTPTCSFAGRMVFCCPGKEKKDKTPSREEENDHQQQKEENVLKVSHENPMQFWKSFGMNLQIWRILPRFYLSSPKPKRLLVFVIGQGYRRQENCDIFSRKNVRLIQFENNFQVNPSQMKLAKDIIDLFRGMFIVFLDINNGSSITLNELRRSMKYLIQFSKKNKETTNIICLCSWNYLLDRPDPILNRFFCTDLPSNVLLLSPAGNESRDITPSNNQEVFMYPPPVIGNEHNEREDGEEVKECSQLIKIGGYDYQEKRISSFSNFGNGVDLYCVGSSTSYSTIYSGMIFSIMWCFNPLFSSYQLKEFVLKKCCDLQEKSSSFPFRSLTKAGEVLFSILKKENEKQERIIKVSDVLDLDLLMDEESLDGINYFEKGNGDEDHDENEREGEEDDYEESPHHLRRRRETPQEKRNRKLSRFDGGTSMKNQVFLTINQKYKNLLDESIEKYQRMKEDTTEQVYQKKCLWQRILYYRMLMKYEIVKEKGPRNSLFLDEFMDIKTSSTEESKEERKDVIVVTKESMNMNNKTQESVTCEENPLDFCLSFFKDLLFRSPQRSKEETSSSYLDNQFELFFTVLLKNKKLMINEEDIKRFDAATIMLKDGKLINTMQENVLLNSFYSFVASMEDLPLILLYIWIQLFDLFEDHRSIKGDENDNESSLLHLCDLIEKTLSQQKEKMNAGFCHFTKAVVLQTFLVLNKKNNSSSLSSKMNSIKIELEKSIESLGKRFSYPFFFLSLLLLDLEMNGNDFRREKSLSVFGKVLEMNSSQIYAYYHRANILFLYQHQLGRGRIDYETFLNLERKKEKERNQKFFVSSSKCRNNYLILLFLLREQILKKDHQQQQSSENEERTFGVFSSIDDEIFIQLNELDRIMNEYQQQNNDEEVGITNGEEKELLFYYYFNKIQFFLKKFDEEQQYLKDHRSELPQNVVHSHKIENTRLLENLFTDLEFLIELFPKKVHLFTIRGTLYSKKGEYRKGLEDFHNSLALSQQKDACAWNNTALVLQALANESIINVENNNIQNDQRHLNQQEGQHISDSSSTIPLKKRIEKRIFSIGRKTKLMGSLKCFEEALRLVPGCSQLHSNRGFLYLKMGDIGKGIESLERSLTLNPHNWLALKNLGIVELKKKNMKQAFSYLNEAIKVKKKSDPALFLLRGISLIRCDPKQAVKDFTYFLQRRPNCRYGYYYRSVASCMTGNVELFFRETLPVILNEKQKKNDPFHEQQQQETTTYEEENHGKELYYRELNYRGLMKCKLMNIEEGLKDISKAIEIKKDYFHAYLNRALIILEFLDDFETALKDLNYCIKLKKGKEPFLFLKRSQAFEYMGNFQQSEKDKKTFHQLLKQQKKERMLC